MEPIINKAISHKFSGLKKSELKRLLAKMTEAQRKQYDRELRIINREERREIAAK